MKSDNDYRNTSPRRFRIPFNPAAGIPTEPKVQGTRWLNEDEFVQLYRWLECPDTPSAPAPGRSDHAHIVDKAIFPAQRVVNQVCLCRPSSSPNARPLKRVRQNRWGLERTR
jgi:hypothetical protein